MSQNQFSPGIQVVHIKMQIIGTVIKVEEGLVHVQIAENKPLQVWSKEELTVWNAREVIQEHLKKGGYIRNIISKMI